MRSKPPAITATKRPRSKSSIVLATIVNPILLAISCYGFWLWFKIMSATKLLEQHELFMILSLALVPLVVFLFITIAAVQRLEYNRLSSSYQVRLDQLQKRLNAQEDFLHSMTDYNPESIAIFDKNNSYWFVNLSASNHLGFDAKEIIGKSLAKVVGIDRAKKLEGRLNQVRETGKSIETLDQNMDEKGQPRFIQAHFESVKPFGEFGGGVMLREEDVTNLIVERERRENMLRQVIGTLVAVVDRRDPYAAGHSSRVGQLSRAIAEQMVLSEKEIEASEIAGSLMNFGKVLVPREILTKTTALTADELQRVRDSILTSADILSIIDFVGPVVPTLKQVLERFDGTGAPLGLQGDKILATARIVTVANTYVALISPRAHRGGLGFKDAIENMMRDADKVFDRAVVMALSNYVQNSPNKLDWLTPSKQS